jgi:membrane protease subunit HflK
MEQVIGASSKVILDVEDGGNSLMYLPIDQLMKQRPSSAIAPRPEPAAPAVAAETADRTPRSVDRERRAR